MLFAIDQSKEAWKNSSEKELANYYLNAVTYNPVQSGILQMIVDLEVISNEYDIKLDLLLQLIAENYEDVDDCPISKTENLIDYKAN
ncbi:MAG: hypothetical protein IPN33_04460 [Saprospiraceae bacterium]|nr:hypothetical protein [Saprospiraceae bacterium]